ncbi:MAG: FtsX-like permease family protein [Desulfobulbaceae bacterium]|nr:FtsX-like permease family protein [Desulfobulbaceae bacterium]
MNPALEKQLNLLDYSLASLRRRKLKNLGIMLVFAAVIFLIASFQFLTASLTATAQDLLAEAPEIVIQKLSAGRQEALPLSYLVRLEGLYGIRTVAPRIWGYYFSETSGANFTVLAVDPRIMPKGDRLFQALDGHLPQVGQGEVVLGSGVATDLNLAGRRSFSLFRPDLTLKPLTVVGSFKSDTDLLTADLIFTTPEEARDIFAIDADHCTDLCVYVSNPREIATIARKISALLPGTRVLTRPQISQTYRVVFGWRSGFASICLLTALAAFIILAWDKASGLSAEEKREIAILKVLGWQTGDVLLLRCWESLTVAGLAWLLGCTAAYLHVFWWGGELFKPVLLGWSVIHPQLQLLPTVAASDLLLIFTMSVVPYLAATVIPAWRAAIIPPDAAIR